MKHEAVFFCDKHLNNVLLVNKCRIFHKITSFGWQSDGSQTAN